MWIFPRTLPPVIAQYLSMTIFNYSWPWPLALGIYLVYFIIFAKMSLNHINGLTAKYGFLDNKVTRDQVPDAKTTSSAVRPFASRLIGSITYIFSILLSGGSSLVLQ